EKMFLNQEKYIITKHAVERYSSRINYSEKEIKKAIHKDLYSLKNKRIITVGNKEYIFYKNSREFVIKKKKNGTKVLVTDIKHARHKKEKAIRNSIREMIQYEKNTGSDYVIVFNQWKLHK